MQVRDDYEIFIRPNQSWLKLDWRSLVEFRDLLFLLVRRDFLVKYKQTLLGPLWFLIQPLLTTVVFTVIFGSLAKMPTNGVPPVVFYLSGLTIWSYFSQCVSANSMTFILYADMFSKVFFPRLIVPLSTTTSNLIAFGVQLLSLIGFVIYFTLAGSLVHPQPIAVLILPLLVLETAVLALGFGLLFASFTARYRDLVHLISFGLQTWMYASPVIYSTSKIPARYEWLVRVNPMAPIIENFRACFLGTPFVSATATICSVALTVLIFFCGLFQYQRAERTLVDTI